MGEYRIELVETSERLWTWTVHSFGSAIHANLVKSQQDDAEADALAYVYMKHPGIAFELERHPIDPC